LRLESFTSVNVNVCVLWNNMHCSLVDKYHLSVKAYCLHLLPCRWKQEVVPGIPVLICEPTWGHMPQGSNLLVAAEKTRLNLCLNSRVLAGVVVNSVLDRRCGRVCIGKSYERVRFPVGLIHFP